MEPVAVSDVLAPASASSTTGRSWSGRLHYAEAAARLQPVVIRTPLQWNANLSRKYQCNVYLKREDLQAVRSYKLRGAFNMMSALPHDQLQKGVVCASAGNHAQGFAFSCRKLGVKGVVFMPVITPNQKIHQTRMFGEDFIEVRLTGDTFDDCAQAAREFTAANGMTFIPPSMIIVSLRGRLPLASKYSKISHR